MLLMLLQTVFPSELQSDTVDFTFYSEYCKSYQWAHTIQLNKCAVFIP